jgi:phosphatidylinositol alpha 1,6-mannosyltransferase
VDFNDIVLHGVPSIPLPGFRPFRVSSVAPFSDRILRLLKSLSPDVVHVHSHLLIGRSAVRAARQLHLPLVATNHFLPKNLTVHLPAHPSLIRHLEDWSWRDLVSVYNPARVVICPSQTAVRELAARGVTAPLRTISCGVNLSKFMSNGATKTRWPFQRAGLTCMFVGRIEREKNVDQLIRAWSSVVENVDAHLLIVGRGRDLQRCAQLANTLRLARRVTFTGYLRDDALRTAYGNCDVFCHAGCAELQGLVVLEAMAAGKPIVAADALALPELVKDGVNGYTFRLGDIEGLAARLVKLLTEKGMRISMGQASLRAVRDHDHGKTIVKHESLYLSMVFEDKNMEKF